MIFCIPCLVLILYFLILGIFSAKHRFYIKEAWRCFLDKVKGRICSVSFDNKMRLAFSTWLAEKNMIALGRFFYNKKKFEVTLTVVGIVFMIVSIYLLILLIQYLITPPCANGVCPI